MANKVAITNLNASTKTILNTIRANASYEYQSLVPKVNTEADIPKVGDVLYGYPALANQFISALLNRIALVKVKSATFNNAYANLKKGYLEFGETVEEVFVNIAKARVFSAEKAEAREHKRYVPDIKTAFHAINWRAQYPVTIENEQLRMAFTSYNGVEDLIAKIIDSVYTAMEYDEYLLFKYLIIKGIANGKVTPVPVDAGNKTEKWGIAFRGMSNQLTFMKSQYNEAGVQTSTPKNRQVIFMDANFNAQYDVEVLASAFNMDKADFMGRLYLIDDFTTFDNDRFDAIRAESDGIEAVTPAELTRLAKVKAFLCDEEWFQVYDNLIQFTEKYVASGMYWNYFLNTWKTISRSPFSNAVSFTESVAEELTSLNFEVTAKEIGENGTVMVFTPQLSEDNAGATSPYYGNFEFVQGEDATTKGIAITKYGAVIVPSNQATCDIICRVRMGNTINEYIINSEEWSTETAVGTTIQVSV